MILFGFITMLEDTGYMARISFLTDKLMRKAGLNGKSVMPMISGFACAVPAIMSARNIENKKEIVEPLFHQKTHAQFEPQNFFEHGSQAFV